mmetsp:Transcript_103435/g.221181  ORF Transcript_103435/g.221181 Transcript_103435/m.221181 type:complete len:356 (+) Transcript_103435:3-1070(+)
MIWHRFITIGANVTVRAVAALNDSAVFVAGAFAGSTTADDKDAFVARYNASSSDFAWGQRVATTIGDDVAESIAVDSSGVLVVGGKISPSTSAASQAFVARYNADGSKIWEFTLATGADDVVSGVASTAQGGLIFISLTSAVRPNSWEDRYASILQYASNRTWQWSRNVSTEAFASTTTSTTTITTSTATSATMTTATATTTTTSSPLLSPLPSVEEAGGIHPVIWLVVALLLTAIVVAGCYVGGRFLAKRWLTGSKTFPGEETEADEETFATGGRGPSLPQTAWPAPVEVDSSPEGFAKQLLHPHRHEPLAERKKVFKQLLVQWHPDKNPGSEQHATEVFRALQDNKESFLPEV